MALVVVALTAFVVSTSAVFAPLRGVASKSTPLLPRERSAHVGLSASANDTFTRASSLRPPTCIQNTGLSCQNDQGCDQSHGAMECRQGQCYCSSTCSSGEGVCQNEANVLVASGLRLKNAKWPAWVLIASTLDDLIHVASNAQDPMAMFNLYQLPGQGKNPINFLLVPQGSPAHSVSVIHRRHCTGVLEAELVSPNEKEDDKSAKNSTIDDCRHTWKAQTQPMSPHFSEHPSVQDIAVQLSEAPGVGAKAGAITIRGSGKHINRFMFIHEGTYKVTTRSDDPGLGGYWIPDPPLSFSLPAYDGPPCEHAHRCGNSLSVHSATAGSGLLLSLLTAFLL